MSDPYVTITLDGEPRGKGRHRSRIVKPNGKPPFIHNYPDPDTERYEARLADEARLAMLGKPMLTEACSAVVEAFVAIPQSWSQKKQEAAAEGRLMPTGKPDGDNYFKIAADALNKIVYADDAQIVMHQAVKTYSRTPGLRITIWKWFEEEPAPAQGVLIGDFV